MAEIEYPSKSNDRSLVIKIKSINHYLNCLRISILTKIKLI